MPTGGQQIVRCLEAQGCDRVFCVPGESYLEILDALVDSPIETIVARQEGGAAMMAEADGKATGRPGVCLVTRGPGASNAMSGIHIAQQDSTPLLVIVGQVSRSHRGRDAFQEVDFEKTFGHMAKLVVEINDADRISEILGRAYHEAMDGRPGPVVLSVPEDMLADSSSGEPARRILPMDSGPDEATLDSFESLLSRAVRPIVIVGGSRWNNESYAQLRTWAIDEQLPVAASFRRQHLFSADNPGYVGELGIGANPDLVSYIRDSDLVILLGGRLSEIPSQNYTLLEVPNPAQPLIHIHPGAAELGRVYHPILAINASPTGFLSALKSRRVRSSPSNFSRLRDSYLHWSQPDTVKPGDRLQMAEVIRCLQSHLTNDAIITNGAGNYSAWVHRFHRYRSFRSQFAPISGSMGYGLPAAIAAKLRFPDRQVVCFAGDGCIQMTIQELGTASQYAIPIIVIVVDNGMYGTIRMHQERRFPHRVSATGLRNPAFSDLAMAYGFHGFRAETAEELTRILPDVFNADRPALLHVLTDPETISPSATITGLRDGR